MRDDYEGRELEWESDRPYPTGVMIAGIVWIAMGSIIVLNALLTVALTAGIAGVAQQAQLPGQPGAAGQFLGAGMCAGIFIGLVGAAFLFVGVQSVRGTAADTLGNGIGSIIFGVLQLGGGVVQLIMMNQPIAAGVGFLAGAGLLAAGILALTARTDYRAWRREHMPRKAGR